MTTLKDRMAVAIKAGHTPSAMARAAGVDSAAVSHWIAGRTLSLKATSALGLATLTGWNAEWWASGKGPRDSATAAELPAQVAPVSDTQIDGTPAYLAELAAKLAPAQQERLVAVAELLAGPQGDQIRISFSLVERAETPTPGRAHQR